VFSAGNSTMPLSFEVDNFREKSFEVPLQLTAQRVREAVAITQGSAKKGRISGHGARTLGEVGGWD
jgi:hypothetical protein